MCVSPNYIKSHTIYNFPCKFKYHKALGNIVKGFTTENDKYFIKRMNRTFKSVSVILVVLAIAQAALISREDQDPVYRKLID